MKKFFVFQLVLLLSLPLLADEPLSSETRQVPVNRGGEDDGTVCLYFFEDMPSVPYISVADFQELMLPGTTIEVSKTGVNIVSEKFSSDDYMAFTNLMGQVQEGMDNVATQESLPADDLTIKPQQLCDLLNMKLKKQIGTPTLPDR